MLKVIKLSKISLPKSAEQWLDELQQPTIIEIEGEDSSRWRVFSVLIHGNEPSGFFAAFNLIQDIVQKNLIPATNIAISIASVRAAKEAPIFSHRHLANEFDLNRRFGQSDTSDPVTHLAKELTDYLRLLKPEFIVDLHNTSGDGPAFAVSISDHTTIKQLTSAFTNTIVLTQLTVGSLMEQNFNCPTLTIECGFNREPKAHQLAYEGMRKLALTESISDMKLKSMQTFEHPSRLQLQTGLTLDYASNKSKDVDVTLIKDIEQLNHQAKVHAGTLIGWSDKNINQLFCCYDDRHENIAETLIDKQDEKLLLNCDCYIFMATSIIDIATEDCLFYLVKAD